MMNAHFKALEKQLTAIGKRTVNTAQEVLANLPVEPALISFDEVETDTVAYANNTGNTTTKLFIVSARDNTIAANVPEINNQLLAAYNKELKQTLEENG